MSKTYLSIVIVILVVFLSYCYFCNNYESYGETIDENREWDITDLNKHVDHEDVMPKKWDLGSHHARGWWHDVVYCKTKNIYCKPPEEWIWPY